jgi:hypothetical protein
MAVVRLHHHRWLESEVIEDLELVIFLNYRHSGL